MVIPSVPAGLLVSSISLTQCFSAGGDFALCTPIPRVISNVWRHCGLSKLGEAVEVSLASGRSRLDTSMHRMAPQQGGLACICKDSGVGTPGLVQQHGQRAEDMVR